MVAHHFMHGSQAAPYVPIYWDEISDKVKKYVLWDIEDCEKERCWYASLSMSDVVDFICDDDKLIACAWIKKEIVGTFDIPFAHFFFCSSFDLSVALDFWDAIKRIQAYDEVYAVTPTKFRWARAAIKACGFKSVTIIKNSAHVAWLNGLQDVEIMKVDFGKEE